MVCRLADSKISTASEYDFASGLLRGKCPRRRVPVVGAPCRQGFRRDWVVRNLPDGRVELNVTGEEEEVHAFLDRIVQGELHSLIHKQTEKKLDKPVSARGFEIRHD